MALTQELSLLTEILQNQWVRKNQKSKIFYLIAKC